MARIIKQGKCEFVSLDLNGNDKKANVLEDHKKGESFSKLFDLFPKDRNDEDAACDKAIDEKNDNANTLFKLKEKEKDREIIKKAQKEADEIIKAAKSEAEKLKNEAQEILKKAKKDAEEIESTAYALGYEQGQKDGEELGRKQFEIALQHLEAFLSDFKEQTKKLAGYYEAQILQVALAVSKKILEKEVVEDKELITRVLRSALKRTIEGSSIIIHMNPRDYEVLDKDFVSSLSSPGGNKIEIKVNNSTKRGGCTIETEFGLIDASLDSRWLSIIEEIERQLLEKTGFELKESLKVIEPLDNKDNGQK